MVRRPSVLSSPLTYSTPAHTHTSQHVPPPHAGETWDTTEAMDTYYNPIPHFGYSHALSHSPQLKSVPMLPREGAEDLGKGGLGSLL
jgi:hypothetical protein